MKESVTPRLGAGLHTEALGAGSRRRGRGFFGDRIPVRWDVLFPRGQWRVRQWLWVACALMGVAVAAVVLWAALRTADGAPSDGDPPSLNGGIATDFPSDGEETSWPGGDTVDREEPVAESPEEDTAPPAETAEAETETETETQDTESLTDAAEETETASPPPEETAPPVPEGCYPVHGVDVSEWERGVGYLVGETDNLPTIPSRDTLWKADSPPTVLLIHTHPFEGYGEGADWYDPATGGLAQTDTVHDPRGVVALGAALARSLREQGITVVHLRIAPSEGDTAADIYERTRSAVETYLTLYPDIGLILDLRRSAELTEEGAILRTRGELNGDACGQLRISVSGDRSEAAVGRDLAAALALRESLWQTSPTATRPVRVKSGSGIAGARDGVCVLTLELGSAGNTYAEAERLIPPLADGVTRLVSAAK